MTSLNLRLILARHHDIVVGHYSYGSLLDPAWCDPQTTIGRYVSIGTGARRLGANHPIEAVTLHPFAFNPALGMVSEQNDVPRSSLIIDHDAWIGAGCTILPSVSRIGIGAVVGAGSVVTADIPDFAVAVGTPARITRFRFDTAIQKRLIADAPWLMEPRGYVGYSRDGRRESLWPKARRSERLDDLLR